MEKSKYDLITKLKKEGMTIQFGNNGNIVSLVYPETLNSGNESFKSTHSETILMDRITIEEWQEVDVFKDLFQKYLQNQKTGTTLNAQDLVEIEKLQNLLIEK